MAMSSRSETRVVRWVVGLSLGMLASVGIGFGYGLVRPRARA
ncbi:MAG TPA: hypothetical protein VE462_15315 [Propionibacteriaceae bacterium]|nr:hypothetical protein [Propionibacteriaceae bacterium]